MIFPDLAHDLIANVDTLAVHALRARSIRLT
jgi:hypothetical protein